MESFNSCNELLAHLFKAYGSYQYVCGGHIMFQGDLCEIGGAMPTRWCIFMPSPKFPNTVFVIDDYSNKEFMLFIYKGEEFVLDETLAVTLPNYVKDELIATIQGYLLLTRLGSLSLPYHNPLNK